LGTEALSSFVGNSSEEPEVEILDACEVTATATPSCEVNSAYRLKAHYLAIHSRIAPADALQAALPTRRAR
jgi:hypothetical protein